ncbi:MAG: hypothetical protein R2875_02870 [Desulfobacterales bacterium]
MRDLIGFMAIVGSDSDDAKDLVNIQFLKEEARNAGIGHSGRKSPHRGSGGGQLHYHRREKAELKKIEDDIIDLDKIDVKVVVLNYITVEYLATDAPMSVNSLTCRLTISGKGYVRKWPSIIGKTDMNRARTNRSDHYYLNRLKVHYCVECDNDALIDEYTVTYTAELG